MINKFLKIIFILILSLFPLCILSCSKKPAAQQTTTETPATETPPAETPPTETPPVVVPADIKSIVTVGAGINFNSSTGSWSEMDLDPISKNPDIVYYDRTAIVSPIVGALKYAKMTDSGSWKVEIVDTNAPITAITNTCGGGATSANCIGAPNVAVPTASQAQIYDIKHFVSSGVSTAVIAYAFGSGGAGASTSGKSIRFAKRETTGIWTIETAVTGAQILAATTGSVGAQLSTLQYPITGVRILVDDSNRVHLTFVVYASTANNSVYLYSMRSAAGTWSTPSVISTSSPSTLSVVSGAPTYAAGTGLQQAGAAWCKYNSGGTSANATGIVLSTATVDNTPAASTQGFILKCSTANADGSCSAWQGLDFTSGCSGACITTTPASSAAASNQFSRSDLAIDPVTGYIFLGQFVAAPSLTAPAVIATGILTTLSPSSCDSGLSTTAWSTVRAHPTAAQGTMGLRVAADGTKLYLASLTGAAGTNISLSFLPVAHASNWVLTDQVIVDSSTNTIGGGFNFDSTTGVLWGSYGSLTAAGAGATGQDIKAFGAYPGDINSTTGIVNSWFVDQTNSVAQATAVPMLSAKVAPDGTVGYTYFYQEPGTTGPNSHLYYGFKGGPAATPLFGERMVSNSIAGATTFMNGLHPSLAYDSNSNPVISFLNQGIAASTGYLMIARSANKGAYFDLDRVDGSTVTTNTVGQFTSVGVSPSDTIGVSYYDYSTGATGQRLKFAKRQKNGAWIRYVVDGPGSTGTGCDTSISGGIGINSRFTWTSTGRPVIVYQGLVGGVKSLKLAYATEAESSATYTWNCLVLDNTGQGGNTRAEGIGIFLSSSDKLYISHYDLTAGAIRLVTCDNNILTCAAGGASSFSSERLSYIIGTPLAIASASGIFITTEGKIWISFHSTADNGLFIASKSAAGVWSTQATTIEASPANLSSTYTGQYGVMLANDKGLPMLFYRSYENWIKFFSKQSE